MNIVTIPLGLSVGFKATYDSFLTPDTLKIIALGLFAFMLSTAGGIIFGNVMYVLTKGKVNPLIALPVCLLFLWLPVFLRWLARRRILPTSCSCTPWAPTWPA